MQSKYVQMLNYQHENLLLNNLLTCVKQNVGSMAL